MEHLDKIKIGDKIYSLGIDSLSAEEVIYDPTETYASGTVGAELTQHSTDIVSLGTSKQDKLVQRTVTLTVEGWSSNEQTVNVTGVTASNTVIVSPAPASFSGYIEAVIYASAQGNGTLTFHCTNVPASALTVNVVIAD